MHLLVVMSYNIALQMAHDMTFCAHTHREGSAMLCVGVIYGTVACMHGVGSWGE